MNVSHRPSRRGLLAGGATAFAAGALTSSATAHAFQVDRELLDLLLAQEQMLVVHYTAILDTFDDTAFSAAGLTGSARGNIESILVAEQATSPRCRDPVAS